jgi:L-lactate dehydrogenase complex protein LldG
MNSRDAILAKIRAGVAAGVIVPPGHEAARATTVRERLAAHASNLMPGRAQGKTETERVAIFRHWLELAGGDLVEAAGESDVPATVAAYLGSCNQPARIRIGTDPVLSALAWHSEPGLVVTHGRAAAGDSASVTRALAAVAETGTVIVASGPANPVTLSFLPETNIVVVARADVVGPLEDAIAKVRAAGYGLPRTLNMISGPSRSADIGGIPVLGAHGPRRFCVIVVAA